MTDKLDGATDADRLEKVLLQLEELSKRVASLEAALPAVRDTAAVPGANKDMKPSQKSAAPAVAPQTAVITDDELLAVSAALAAYLGVRVRIKRIRLLSSRAWAQQGRVWIQASHNLQY